MNIKAKVSCFLLFAALIFFALNRHRLAASDETHVFSQVKAEKLSQHPQTDCPVTPGYFTNNEVVNGVLGTNVTLPCFPNFNIKETDDLEWTKGNDDIYMIRDKQSFGPYEHRALVKVKDFRNGFASLKLFNVTESDRGEYCCCVVGKMRSCTKLTLGVSQKKENQVTAGQKIPSGTSAAQDISVSVVTFCTITAIAATFCR